MKHVVLATSAALALAFSGLTHATSLQSLSESQVSSQVIGKTITTIPLVTMDGSLTNNTFTGYFNTNGELEGRMANQPENGPITDKGTWSLKTDGTLCATWNHWNSSKPICVSIYKVKNGLLFVNQQSHKLETIVLEENIKSGNKIG